MALIAGRYRLLEEIGRGGSAVVHRAWDTTTSTEVALKLLVGAGRKTRQAVGRFVREANLTARLRHPNAVRILGFGESDHGLYLVMELLRGSTLEERISSGGRLPPRAAAGVAACVASALAEAHAHEIVHRDVKPSNVFLAGSERGSVVKLMDFGLARFVDPERNRAHGMYATTLIDGQERPMLGTVQYRAPELVKGKGAGALSDLYSLGATLYAMLAGEPPFLGDNAFMVMKGHVKDPPPPLYGVPEPLETLVMELLGKDPTERPQSATAVDARLREWLLISS